MMRCLLMVFLALALGVPSGLTEELPNPDKVKLSADRMEADEKSQAITFSGKVVAQQADMTVYADKMVLSYTDRQSGEIEKIDMEGGLRIVQGDRVATADRGVFENNAGRIVLYGNAEVHQAGNRIDGDEIIYDLNEARSVVKSHSDSRVKAVFDTGGEKE